RWNSGTRRGGMWWEDRRAWVMRHPHPTSMEMMGDDHWDHQFDQNPTLAQNLKMNFLSNSSIRDTSSILPIRLFTTPE
ncbi:hypothetical protein ACFQ49_14830, partial [Kroppenstedtia eburnea]|uniref:hypothetical protein n=1 Tax=Kroppenstedtia eburnea TaxID=714067 RepID=UPI00362B1544